MPTVTVLEKLYGSVSPAGFEERYSGLVKDLDVKVCFAGTTNQGWIQLDVSGADETIALSLLEREFGLAPASLTGIGRFSVMRGRVAVSEKKREPSLCGFACWFRVNKRCSFRKKFERTTC